MEILAVKDLNFRYPEYESDTLSKITLSINEGEFVTVCGCTGGGKSTLLRMLKNELVPVGDRSGEVLFKGRPVQELTADESACGIGFVMQNPDDQIVTDKVWHELAFGPENIGMPSGEIHRRVSEMASYFGIEDWFDIKISELSGGQKQLLNLASVMVMHPDILILDEPTAQLDPIAASDFITVIKRMNSQLGLTVIIAEHRLEQLIPDCDKLLVIEDGRAIAFDEPRMVCGLIGKNKKYSDMMPAAVRLFNRTAFESGKCPLTVKEGRGYVENNFSNTVRALPQNEAAVCGKPALEMEKVCFRYQREANDVLREMDLCVYENEFLCILGGNGSGKTTAMNAAAGLLKPYSGRIKVFGKKLKEYKNASLYNNCLSMLPQNVQTVFLRNTVREELDDAGCDISRLPFDLSGLMNKHPYDLSGGEQQLTALAKVLSSSPKLLLLDEPTKGLDAGAKQILISVFKDLKKQGMTIAAVTHDVEFAAMCADRCAFFFRGEITNIAPPHEFFSGNSFYTTAVSLMTRGFYDNAVTVDDVEKLYELNGGKGGSV